MKGFLFALLLFLSLKGSAQYYYQDIVGTRQSAALIKTYRTNKVKTVTLHSYTINNTPLDNFFVQQEYLPSQLALKTTTKTDFSAASYLISYIDEAGHVIKTTDSSDGIINTSNYTYTPSGNLSSIVTVSSDTLTATQIDEHLWLYDVQGKLNKMLRIKNHKDTTYVSFKLDAAGNVTEEQETHLRIPAEPFQYYYTENNLLSDVVRYNAKAGRLLPQYMFEYDVSKRVIQQTTVPQHSSQYLIWRYGYDNKGLKTKEVIYNKDKELTGKVEYEYTFSN